MSDFERKFIYHEASNDQQDRYAAFRAKAREFAELIQASSNTSREQSLAITKIEEALMWANAGIARNEEKV